MGANVTSFRDSMSHAKICGEFGVLLELLARDNLKLRGLPLANQCCMCCYNEESVDHLLLHYPVAHSLWVQMLQVFRIQWVMLGSMESLVFCWSYWLGKFSSDIWNMVPSCLMWVVWMERNRRSFEAKEKSLVQLQALCQSTFLIGLGAGVLQIVLLLLSFLLPLELSLKLLFLSLLFFVAISCVHCHEHLVSAFFAVSS